MRTVWQTVVFVIVLMIAVFPAWTQTDADVVAAAERSGIGPEDRFSLFTSDTDDILAFEFLFSLTGQRRYEMIDSYEDLGGQRAPRSWYESTEAILDYRSRYLSLFVDWAMVGDDIYDPSEPYMFGRYLYIKDAHVLVDRHPFSIKAGRTTQTDVIDSPYSLYVNSEPIPAPQLETRYAGDFFFYTSRWVGLNRRSDKTYFGSGPDSPFYIPPDENGSYVSNVDSVPYTGAPYAEVYPDGVPWADRGANFKVYGLNLGKWRIGFQEGAVYMQEYFNAEFFLSPMPMYFTQIIIDGGNKPWGEYANSKHTMGFFADRTTPGGYLAGQILVDDINPSAFSPVDVDFQNRLAWSIGGYREFGFGQVGLYYAGASKYTFSATSTRDIDRPVTRYDGLDEVPLYYSQRPYPYTYYPAVEYAVDKNKRMPLDYRQNYLGYKHGENNMAFKLDYTNTFYPENFGEIGFYSSIEYVLNGAKSPANPWHEDDSYEDIDDAILLLNDDLEQQVLLRARAERPVSILGTPFTVFVDGELGLIFSAMKLEPPFADDDPNRFVEIEERGTVDRNRSEPWIYRPQPGDHEVIWHVTVGVSYRWQVK